MDREDIIRLAAWSEPPVEVQTKYGPRLLLTAEVTSEFSKAWKTHGEELKSLGAGFRKGKNGNWELVWWIPVGDQEGISSE